MFVSLMELIQERERYDIYIYLQIFLHDFSNFSSLKLRVNIGKSGNKTS